MRKALAVAALLIPLALAGCAEHERSYYSGPYAPAYERFEQRGFHDGFEAGRQSMAGGLASTVMDFTRVMSVRIAAVTVIVIGANELVASSTCALRIPCLQLRETWDPGLFPNF